jgi:hypothetical protein
VAYFDYYVQENDCEFFDGENMERSQNCLLGPARNCVETILLTKDAEKIGEHLLEEAKPQKPIKKTPKSFLIR